MFNIDDANEPLRITSEWMDARESDLTEAAFVAMEKGDTIAQTAAESQLSFHRIIRDAVEETELR